jgi:hypothetical protein
LDDKRNLAYRLQDKKSRIFEGKYGLISRVRTILLYKAQKEEEDGEEVGGEEKK